MFLPWGMCVEPICSDSESKELSVVNFSSEKRAGRLSVVNIMASSFRAVQSVTFYYFIINVFVVKKLCNSLVACLIKTIKYILLKIECAIELL